MSRALVISGGGSKGAFAVGVIKKLLSDFPSLQFDMLIGTSTGSLIAPLVALNRIALLEQLYTTQRTENIVRKNNLGDRINTHSIFGANPLWNLISKYYTDQLYQEIRSSGKRLFINTTCLQTGEITVFTNELNPPNQKHYIQHSFQSADQFRRAVMASACQPVFMPPVKVNLNAQDEPNPNFQYVDGGVREYAGVQIAIDKGASEIFTILLSPSDEPTEMTEYKTLFPILARTIDIFTTDVGKNDLVIPGQYNDALRYIQQVKQNMLDGGITSDEIDKYFYVQGDSNPFENKIPLKLFTIRPTAPLGGGPGGLNFDPEEMKGMLATGELVAGDFIAALDRDDISWA